MTNKLEKKEVEKIAKLSNLKLTESELDTFTKQLAEVIDYNVAQLSKVNTDKVEPLLNVSGLENALRDDITEVSLSEEEALKNAPKKHNGFFKVEQILDQDIDGN